MNLAIVAASIAGPVSAKTDTQHFKQCDGYKSPNKRGDGMNSGSFLFGLAKSREDIRRSTDQMEPVQGIEACRKALADPLLKPEFVERRASLTQSLAYHQMALFSYDDAMATLDQIDAMEINADPILYDRGIGLGNQLLRAYAQIKDNRHDEAMATLDAVDALRPYSVTNRRVTDSLRLMIDDRLDHQIDLMKRRAAIDPTANMLGHVLALEFGRFEEAIEFGSGMVFDLPKNRGGWKVSGEALLNYELILTRAEFAGGMAYAKAAIGDEAGANQLLLEARDQLEIAMAPPPPRKNNRPQKKSVLRDFELRKLFGQRGVTKIDLWSELIELRKEVPELDLEQLKERIDALPSNPGPIIIDLVSRAGGEKVEEREQLVASLLEISNNRRTKDFDVPVAKFLKLIPHPEARENQVKLKRGGNFFSENGFSLKKMDGDDDFTIRFTDMTATRATVEEFSIAAAAKEAQQRGFDKLLLQSTRTIQRTTNVYTMYGGSAGSHNSGREAQLRVRLVKSDAVPAELQGSAWRMLDVATLNADLANLPQRLPKKRR